MAGEEFVIIMPETELEDAKALTERIRSELECKKLAINKSGEQLGTVSNGFVWHRGAHRKRHVRKAGRARRRQTLRSQAHRAQSPRMGRELIAAACRTWGVRRSKSTSERAQTVVLPSG
jgi:GGDEF domain-containing protein